MLSLQAAVESHIGRAACKRAPAILGFAVPLICRYIPRSVKYDPAKHHRRSIRLKNFDYSQSGYYFITVVTQKRELLFGEVHHGESRLNEAGRIVQAAWDDLPNHFAGVSLDAFIVMPNHVHGIVALQVLVGAGLKPAPTQIRAGLFEVVRAFKTFSARSVNKSRGRQGVPVWQRNYY